MKRVNRQRISDHYRDRVMSGKLKAAVSADNEARLAITTDWARLFAADLVIEAVFEELAASRSDHLHHGAARTRLEGALAAVQAGATVTLMPMVLASVLRPVTSPNTFVQPTPRIASTRVGHARGAPDTARAGVAQAEPDGPGQGVRQQGPA
jgi:hypothetical protein